MGDLVYRCVIAASRAVFRGLGLRIELRGEEHLPTSTARSSRATT